MSSFEPLKRSFNTYIHKDIIISHLAVRLFRYPQLSRDNRNNLKSTLWSFKFLKSAYHQLIFGYLISSTFSIFYSLCLKIILSSFYVYIIIIYPLNNKSIEAIFGSHRVIYSTAINWNKCVFHYYWNLSVNWSRNF